MKRWIRPFSFWSSLLLITYLALTPHHGTAIGLFNDKLLHASAFGYLAGGLIWRYPGWATPGRTAIGLMAYGGLIEWVQTYIPSRQSSLSDMIADALGIVAALALIRLMRWGKRSNQMTPATSSNATCKDGS